MRQILAVTGLLAVVTGLTLAAEANAAQLPADCSTAAAPKQPIEVSVGGVKFAPKAIGLRFDGLRKMGDDEFDTYRLTLRNVDDIFAPLESEIVVIVRKGQQVDGKTFRKLPTKEIGKQPSPIPGVPEVQGWSFKDREGKGNFNHVEHVASLRLEFAKRQGDTITGSVYLCVPKGQTTIFNKTPTKEDSYAVGTFQARIEKK